MLDLYKKTYKEAEVKVKNHDHIFGKFLESMDYECNLNIILSEKTLSFKTLENMISKYIKKQ